MSETLREFFFSFIWFILNTYRYLDFRCIVWGPGSGGVCGSPRLQERPQLGILGVPLDGDGQHGGHQGQDEQHVEDLCG